MATTSRKKKFRRPAPAGGRPRVSRESQLYKALSRGGAAELVLRGQMLVIDPSSGSQSSLPGYAIYRAGECIDSGLMEMPVGTPLATRLWYLNKHLREDFHEKFDILLLEMIPAFRFSGGRASASAQLSLHKAVGVVEANFEVAHRLYIAPQTWRGYASAEHLAAKEAGAHTDERDAITMGEAVVEIAREIQQRRKS